MSETSTALAVRPAQTSAPALLPQPEEWKLMTSMATALYQSGLLPKAIGSPQAAVAVIQKGRELAIPPMQALTGIVVIQGKPTCGSELMLALLYRDHGDEALMFEETSAERCVVSYKRRGWPERKTYAFTADDAKRAGLIGGSNPTWGKYPAAMLRARAISAVARLAFPDSVGGMYTPDELGARVAVDGAGNVSIVDEPGPESLRARPEPTPLRAVAAAAAPHAYRWFVDRSIGDGCQATNGQRRCPAHASQRDATFGGADIPLVSLCDRHAAEVAKASNPPELRGAPPPVPAEMAAPPADNLDALHQDGQTAAEGRFEEVDDDDPFEHPD